MEQMAYAGGVAAIAVLAVGWSVLLWRATRALGRQAALEERVARLTEALTLLTDTTEAGFRTVSEQLAAIREPAVTPVRKPAAAPRRTTTGRVVRAARRGQSVTEIAAAEQVSEGEVRLRLHLADAARQKQEVHDAPLRTR
jgi:hypothetical protein